MSNVFLRDKEKNIKVGKIVCVGRNYAKHAAELGNEVPEFPIIFLKPPSVMIRSGEAVYYPDYSDNMHYETELVLLIGGYIKNADDKSAAASIAGYGVGLDMTLRDLQNKFRAEGNPWTLAKVFDGSAVVSDFISRHSHTLNLEARITLKQNGVLKQNSQLKEMIFNPAEIVKYISHRMALEEGDLIFTGTPEGVGKVERGDTLEGKINGIGTIQTEIK
jgi:5-carboxymethyl-2-hydroxymuconate isomerase